MAQCQGIKKDGTQCSRIVSDKQKYCWQHQPRFRRWFPKVTIGAVIFVVLTSIGFLADLSGLGILPPLPKTERMTGVFRIAVAGFAEQPASSNTNIGFELAEGVFLQLEKNIEELNLGFPITIWGPDRVGVIQGANEAERAGAAAQLVEEIGANLIVYGIVDNSETTWQLLPEFYISTAEFYDADEITGPHSLGTALPLSQKGNVAELINTSQDLSARTQILTQVAIGLAYYAIFDYEQAYNTFTTVAELDAWEELEGKEVVYLLAGNAAIKNNQLELAEEHYQASLDLNPDYSRGLLGIAGVQYMRALQPYEETSDRTKIDTDVLELALSNYNLATLAQTQSSLANIPEKVHFGQGQTFLAQALAGDEQMLDKAAAEFNAVIATYDDENDQTLRHLAAESHARLGLMHFLSGRKEQAVEEYEAAVALLYDNPNRQSIYEERVSELKEALDATSN